MLQVVDFGGINWVGSFGSVEEARVSFAVPFGFEFAGVSMEMVEVMEAREAVGKLTVSGVEVVAGVVVLE